MSITELEYAALLLKNPNLAKAEKLRRERNKPKEWLPVVRDEKTLLEMEIQGAVIEWRDNADNLFLMPEIEYLHAIPNDSKRTKYQGWTLRCLGLRSGMPDLCLPISRKPFFSLYIEMKTWKAINSKKQGLSDNQIIWIDKLRKRGHRVEVCWSPSETINLIKRYLGYL